jgi:two-component system CheB/CheR fusion protein
MNSLTPYAASIVQAVRQPLVVLEADLRVRSANRCFYETFQMRPENTEGRLLYELGAHEWDLAELRSLLTQTARQGRELVDYTVDQRPRWAK